MPKTWVQNTGTIPKIISGHLVQPGDGTFVEEGPFQNPLVDGGVVRLNPITGGLEGPSGPINVGGFSTGLSGVTYDGGNRATGFAFGTVTYTVAYASGSITVTGSDGSVQTIALDGSGRISGVA